MLIRIISFNKQYLKLFNRVPKLNYWYNIAILGTIWLCANKTIPVEYLELSDCLQNRMVEIT